MNTEMLNRWGEDFLNFAWPMLWQSSLLIGVIFILDLALRRKVRAAIRHALWLVVLVKLLLPPTLALPTSPSWWVHTSAPPPAKAPPVSFTVTYGEQVMPDFPTAPAPIIPPKPPSLKLAAWTFLLSGIVSAGLLAWLLVRWRGIVRKVRTASKTEGLGAMLNESARVAGLRSTVRLKLTEDSMSPAVCGLFRPVILLPQSLVKKLSAGQLRAVLLHELIHLRRGDVWVNCAQALLQIVYWWHPLLWLANARIRRVREEAVDDAVMLALRDDADIYAPTLLEVAKFAFRRPLASLGLVGILESRSALRQRIERLMDFRAPRKAGLTVVSVLGILGFAAVALPMGQAPEKTNESGASSQSNSLSVADAPKDIFKAREGTNIVIGTLSDRNSDSNQVNSNPPATNLEMRVFKVGVDSHPIPANFLGLATNSAPSLKDLSNKLGVDLTAPGRNIAYSDGKGLLMVKATPSELDTIERVVQTFNQRSGAETLAEPKTASTSGKGVQQMTANYVFQQTHDIHTSSNREAIYGKLNSIRLDKTPDEWANGIPLSEALRFLIAQSKLLDPDKKGINFLFNPNVAPSTVVGASNLINPTTGLPETHAPGVAPQIVEPSTIYVKLTMNNNSLRDVLDAVVMVADRPIRYTIEDYAVVISPKPLGPERPILEMRVFKVDTNEVFLNLQKVMKLPANASTLSILKYCLTNLFPASGMDYQSPPKTWAFNDRLGVLFVKATPLELDELETIIIQLNSPAFTGFVEDSNLSKGVHALEQSNGVETLASKASSTNLEMRVFKTDTNVFLAAVRDQMAMKVSDAAKPPDLLKFFSAIGVDLTAPGTSIAFNDRLGMLFVKATPAELDTIERVVQVLNQVAPEIHIKARFIEVEQDNNSARGLDWYLGSFTNGPIIANGRGAPTLGPAVSAVNPLGSFPGTTAANQMTGILTDSQFRTLLQALEHRKGFETLAEPEVTTISGRQTQMKAVEVHEIVTNYAFHADSYPAVSPQIGKFEFGPTVDLVPHVLADGYTINLSAIAVLQEFLGYDSATNTVNATNNFGVRISTPTVRPGFRVQQAKANVYLWDGQTLVLGNFKNRFTDGGEEVSGESKFVADAEKKNGTAGKELLVFITATIVDPAGNRVHSDDNLPFNTNSIPPQPH